MPLCWRVARHERPLPVVALDRASPVRPQPHPVLARSLRIRSETLEQRGHAEHPRGHRHGVGAALDLGDSARAKGQAPCRSRALRGPSHAAEVRALARIRSIHPGYNASPDIVQLTVPCRFHFSLLWTYADDEGRGIDNDLLIKAALWPLDEDVSPGQIAAWQQELEQHGRITRYTGVDGRRYFVIHKFERWQRPSRPLTSRLPAPPGSLSARSRSDHGAITERSANGHRGSMPGAGEGEGEGEGAGAALCEKTKADASLSTVAGAVELLLLRLGKLEASTTKRAPSAWLSATRTRLTKQYQPVAVELLRADPTMSATALADALVPPTSATPRPTSCDRCAETPGIVETEPGLWAQCDHEPEP